MSDSNRILLIYPPSRTQSHLYCPAGIMLLASVLEKGGYEVKLVDSNAVKKRLGTEDIIHIAREYVPSVIGITLLTPMVKEAYRLASQLKENGFTRLLAGGPHATILPEEAIAHGFDGVVLGEGEGVIVGAVRALQGLQTKEKVQGWVYRSDDGEPSRLEPRVMISNLDDIPFPARHLVNPSDYGLTHNRIPQANLFSSRGCPARCAFCAGQIFGRNFRFRSASNVLSEIFEMHEKWGTTHFHFMDDSMTVDLERVTEICRGLIARKLKITWSVMTRIDLITEDLLDLMKEAGCVQIDYGVESGHAETLRKIHKPQTVEMVRKIVPLTAKKGIKPYVFFILGFPWERTEAVKDTLDLMVELSQYVDVFHPAIASILIPFPGTEIYEKYKEQYHLENWWLSSDRCYDAPKTQHHSYFEQKMFSRGAVLDADFFHYSRDMKEMIHNVFKFMYVHNLKKRGKVVGLVRRFLVEFSQSLARLSPSLERVIFAPIARLESVCAG